MPADVLLVLGLALDTTKHSLLSRGAAGLLAGEHTQPVLPNMLRHCLAVFQNVLLQVLNCCCLRFNLLLAVLALSSWALRWVLRCSNRVKLSLANVVALIYWLLGDGLICLAEVYVAARRGHLAMQNKKISA
jgi:hypothetical protein